VHIYGSKTHSVLCIVFVASTVAVYVQYYSLYVVWLHLYNHVHYVQPTSAPNCALQKCQNSAVESNKFANGFVNVKSTLPMQYYKKHLGGTNRGKSYRLLFTVLKVDNKWCVDRLEEWTMAAAKTRGRTLENEKCMELQQFKIKHGRT